MEVVQNASRRENRARKIEHGLDANGEADSVERANFDQLQREPCGGDQTVFKPAPRPDEQHLGGVSLLKFLSNGERGDDMTAGAAARQNCAHDLKYI